MHNSSNEAVPTLVCALLLPPPVNGQTAANEFYARRLARLGFADTINLMPASGKVGPWNRLPQLLKALGQLASRAGIMKKGGWLYVVPEAGLGRFATLSLCVLATLFGLGICFHHHASSYLINPSWSYRLMFRLAKRSAHVVLDVEMLRLLKHGYSTGDEIIVLNNVLVAHDGMKKTSDSGSAAVSMVQPTRMIVGLLSNLTAEKGLYRFLDLAEKYVENPDVEFKLAGPVDPSELANFTRMLANLPNLTYLGPLYGESKFSFYEELDLFVFPSSYRHEAQPISIYEALLSGAQVLTSDVGFIESSFCDIATVVPLIKFDESFDAQIMQWKANPMQYRVTKAQALENLRANFSSAVAGLDQLTDLIYSRSVSIQ